MDTHPPRQTAFLRWRRRHALPPGSSCYNCAAILQGPWCHACGQLGEDYHRATTHLVWELIEGLFHADGRLWHTLPRLLIRPGALTRDYLDGKRASQVPPLRIFFIVLLLVFFIGEAFAGLDRAQLIHLDPAKTHMEDLHFSVCKPWDAALTTWTRTHLERAEAHPDRFVNAMADWAHDFAFLSLPIFGFTLAGIFVFRRGYVLFDHMIFAMHSLSFLGLVALVTILLSQWTMAGLWLLCLVPVHQFFHLRGVYRTGIFGTLVRLSVLATATTIAFSFVLVGLVLAGMAALKA
jgi:hypothetical protein